MDNIYVVYNGVYEEREVVLVTTSQDIAIRKYLQMDESPFIEIWQDGKFITVFGDMKSDNTIKDYESIRDEIEKRLKRVNFMGKIEKIETKAYISGVDTVTNFDGYSYLDILLPFDKAIRIFKIANNQQAVPFKVTFELEDNTNRANGKRGR